MLYPSVLDLLMTKNEIIGDRRHSCQPAVGGERPRSALDAQGIAQVIVLLLFFIAATARSQTQDSWRDPRHFSWVGEKPATKAPDAGNEGPSLFSLMAFVLGSSVIGLAVLAGLRKWNRWQEAVAADKNAYLESVLAEDSNFQEFLRTMHEDPQIADDAGAAANASSTTGSPSAEELVDSSMGLTQASKNLVALWAEFLKANQGSENGESGKGLPGLREAAERLIQTSSSPHSRPVFLLASAIQGLLKQLSAKATNINDSTLRTASGAIDLIELLCGRTLRPDLLTEPPIRLLVVDDEPISRGILSSALRKTFNEPDLAPDGRTALTLAGKRPYDLVLLDVEMPGLDGFEVCSKIHNTAQNFLTPVVFVTSHCDFNSRAKSAAVGANDLIGKPFLAFEIVVKALTLVLRTRVGSNEEGRKPSEAEKPDHARHTSPPATLAAKDLAALGRQASRLISESEPVQDLKNDPKRPHDAVHLGADLARSPDRTPALRDMTTADQAQATKRELVEAFFTGAPAHLRILRARLIEAQNSTLLTDRNELICEIFVGFHAVRVEAERAQIGAAFRIACALESMLKKLVERPGLCMPSVLDTAISAVETIDQICQTKMDFDLPAAQSQVLVVDDDPISQRAVSGALQLSMGRPDTADCGEAALRFAREKPYDVIFLDVLMPGIDGFEVAEQLRETELNAETSVVFVTSQDDIATRAKASTLRACALIPKPVLPSQIMLQAITSLVRGRLGTSRDEAIERLDSNQSESACPKYDKMRLQANPA
jgi:CheY-like chemotaxis protein